MIIDLQKSIVAFLTPLMEADETLEDVVYEVRTAMEEADNPLPEDRHVVTVLCREAKGALTDLKEGMIEIYVATPMEVDGVTIAGAALVEAAVGRCWDRTATPTAKTLLATAIAANLTGWISAGYFADGWGEGREDTNYLPVYAVKVGIYRG